VRVLALAHSFPRGADDPVGSFILRLAVALRSEGIDTRVIAPMAPGLARRETFEGIEVRRFRYAPASWETLAYQGDLRDQARSPLGMAKLSSFLVAEYVAGLLAARDFKPDIVHAHWVLPSGLVALALAGGWRVPLVTTSHGTDVRLARGNPVAGRVFAEVVRGADAVTMVSSWLAQQAKVLAPDVEPLVAPMPVLPDHFHPGSSRDGNRLLFVGKLNTQKGIGHLLHALSRMRARPTLEIVMGVGSERDHPATEALAQSLGVADRLRWFPLLSQADLVRRYQEATALVAPFEEEGLGLVPIEAQLCEAPVVGFASGGLTDIVRPEETGLLVPPGDVAALAAALDRLLALPDRGAGWGREGRRHALEAFGPAGAARRYAELYRRLLGVGEAGHA
jgi:glycosyltransferase involved in cell wall biosynthesis